ncbi:MAG: acetyl-CoA carboxylase carboxyl transferase subunit alpha [Frankia sp.]
MPATLEAINRPVRTAWSICRSCRETVYGPRLARAAGVCPDCGWHAPMTATDRIIHLLDPGTVESLDVTVPDTDPLEFVDTQPYPERLAAARRRTGMNEAVLCARGRILGNRLVVAVMDFRFFGGSLSAAVGEAVTVAAETALTDRVPLLIVTASGGARMQEGVVALMQMAKTSQALGRLDAAGLLTITLVTDPTFGGVAASFATLGDVIITEPGARLGFAGPRVIAQTIRETLPDGFQTAQFLQDHGIVDLIRPRGELRATLGRLLSVAAPRATGPIAVRPESEVADHIGHDRVITDPDALPDRDPWEVVRLARRLGRPTTLDYATGLLDDFTELHGDRMTADCPALVGGIGRLDGIPVVAIGTQKGQTGPELAARNYGMPNPAGYRKAARLMRLAAKLGLPVVTFVDTAGAYPGIEAERTGQSVAIAENLRLMGALPVPIVAVVTGEGGSGGALALAVADRVLMSANAVYSVISPEGCAAILWDDPAAAPRAANALRVDARNLLRLGIIDGVVPEPDGSAQADPLAAVDLMRGALATTLRSLIPNDPAHLVERRWERFRRFGAPDPSRFAVQKESA